MEFESEEHKSAYLASIKLLTKRDYSKYKLKEKLRQKEFSEQIIAETIELLLEKKYLQEEEYIRLRIRGLAHKNYSASSIKMKLEAEEIYLDTNQVKEIYKNEGFDAETQCRQLAMKKIRQKDPETPEDYQKIIRFLLSKGFEIEESKRALRAISHQE